MFRKLCFLCLVSFFVPTLLFAVNPKKLRHADRNKDGVITRKEWQMEKKWEHRQHLKKVNTWWERMADTDGNGIVDEKELSAWKKLEKEKIDLNADGVISAKERRLCWRHARSRVNNPLEEKYDINSDGWLEPSEVKNLLRDKYLLVKTKGKAKVDTALEAAYDSDENGIIDPQEAKQMFEDTK